MVLLDAAQQLQTGSLIYVDAPAAQSSWSAGRKKHKNTSSGNEKRLLSRDDKQTKKVVRDAAYEITEEISDFVHQPATSCAFHLLAGCVQLLPAVDMLF